MSKMVADISGANKLSSISQTRKHLVTSICLEQKAKVGQVKEKMGVRNLYWLKLYPHLLAVIGI